MKPSIHLLILLSLISLYAPLSAQQNIYLLGTRKDVGFLNAEGDILRPLSYEFNESDFRFHAIDIDSADNRLLFAEILSQLDERGGITPALIINTTFLYGKTLTYEQAYPLLKKGVSPLSKKTKKQPRINDPVSPPIHNPATEAAGHFITATVIILSILFVSQARKRLLRK